MDKLTFDDIETLAAGIPDNSIPLYHATTVLSDVELRKLYTSQTYHESEIDAPNGVIAWCAKKHYYRHFETHQNFIDFIVGSSPETRYWSERIYAQQMQKLRIDYDCKTVRVNIDQIRTAIRDLFQELYNEYLFDYDLIVCDMSDATKQSIHFIINEYYVKSNVEARYFAEKLKVKLGDIGAGIDLQIYAKATGLRAILNSKDVDGSALRTKIPPADIDLITTLITYVHMCRPLPNIAGIVNVPKIIKIIGDPTIAIRNIPVKLTEGFEFRGVNGVFINFTRTSPSVCAISGETHHKDNTLFGIITDEGVKLRCRHCNGCVISHCDGIQVVREAGNAKRTPQLARTLKIKRITNVCKQKVMENELKSHCIYKYVGVKNQYGDMMNEIDVSSEIVPTDDILPTDNTNCIPNTIFVRAQMGIGKTSALKRFIDKYEPKTILAISFRVSFTAGMCTKFDLTSYRTITGGISCENNKRVMVQCESLHRVKPVAYELLILDEIQSIIQQMFSYGTHKFAMQSWAIFEHMVRYSRTVVCMDAHIDQSTVDLITQIRGGSSILHINNAVARMSIHKIVEKKSTAIALIIDLLAKGQHIVVPTTSCELAERVFEIAKKVYPNKKIKIYTSKTPESVKIVDFANVNIAWANQDLLIFTPTVLAGLSYTRSDYDVAVCLWNDRTVDIFGSLQMLGRIRDIASGTYYHYISERSSHIPDTTDTLLQHITESYDNFVIADGPGYDIAGFYEDGRVMINDTPRFRAWLSVQARLNYSKNNFLEAFVRELKLTGGDVSLYIANDDVSREKIVNSQLKQIGNDIKATDATIIATSREISPDEYAEIITVRDMSVEDRAAIEKYIFRRFYSYDGEITVVLLLKYDTLRLKQQYLRRKRLRTFNGDIDEGLCGLISGVIVTGNIMGVDIEHIKNMFDVSRDKIAIALMKIFGEPFDSTYVLTRAELIAKLHAGHDKLVRESVHTCKIFGAKIVKLPAIGAPDYVKSMLDYINGKLDCQYGVKIKSTDKNQYKYKLYDSHVDLFDDQYNIKK